MKRALNIIRRTVWACLAAYAVVLLSCQLPPVQRLMGNGVASLLERQLGTKVEVGKVDIGLFNRVIIDEISILDKSGKPLLEADRLAGKVNVLGLIKGDIKLSSLQLIAPRLTIWRKSEDSAPNCQFLLDALFASDKVKKRTTKINVDELTVTDGSVTYDVQSRRRTSGKLDPSHIEISNFNTHIAIDTLDGHLASLNVKRLSLSEKCGMTIDNLSAGVMLDTRAKNAKVYSPTVRTTNSNLKAEGVTISWVRSTPDISVNGMNGSVSPADVRHVTGAVLPVKQVVDVKADFSLTDQGLNIADLHLSSADKQLLLQCNGRYSMGGSQPSASLNISKLQVPASIIPQIGALLATERVTMPPLITKLGIVDFAGHILLDGHSWQGRGEMKSSLGTVRGQVGYDGTCIDGRLRSEGFQMDALLADGGVRHVAGQVEFRGSLSSAKARPAMSALNVKGDISSITLSNPALTLRNIRIDGNIGNNIYDGNIAMRNEYGQLNISGRGNLATANPSLSATLTARDINASVLGLSGKGSQARIGFDMHTDIEGLDFNTFTGTIGLKNVHIYSPTGDVSIPYVDIAASDIGNQQRRMTLHSPSMDARIEGDYNLRTLASSVQRILSRRIPALPAATRAARTSSNNCKIGLEVYSADWFRSLTGADLHCTEPILVEGLVHDATDDINLSVSMPAILYKGSPYEHTQLTMTTHPDTIYIYGTTRRVSDKSAPLDLQLTAEASGDGMNTSLSFDNHNEKRHISGELLTQTNLFYADSPTPTTHISILPSTVYVNEAAWNVQPSDIVYRKGQLIVDHISVRNGLQYISAEGIASGDDRQKIDVGYHGLDIGLLSDILNVNGVEFDGHATGRAQVYGLFDTPRADAQLDIEEFCFTGDPLGQFSGRASWNGALNRISVHGRCEENNSLSTTLVEGNIALSPLQLDLDIGVNNTQTAFMENYLHGVVGKMDARATGGIHVFGTSHHVDIEGQVTLQGPMHISPLNTTYELNGDTVDFLPGHIAFRNLNLSDDRGKKLHFRGDVFHDYLKGWVYDLHLNGSDVSLLRQSDLDGNTVGGTIYADADIEIDNRTGDVNINAECTPRHGSVIQYNASQREYLHEREFLRWHDATRRPEIYDLPIDAEANKARNLPQLPTDVKLNMVLNATPDLVLRVVMNDETDDYIDLQGNGSLRATYHNKGALNIYGNYVVREGSYRMTIQNLFTRLFTFQNGGTIVFAGDPLNATLNLQAVHTLNGVSLADLQIGNSFKTNNIRVNCLLNLHGTPIQPQLGFDLEMPTAGTDVAQMVRSLINSQEELNQQVVYLLTVGRFYNQSNANLAQDATAQSHTSLAMQSLLSGTVSGQLNNLLSSLLPDNNWTIGANISTGDEGWNNAEYEGLLSGRLLNNRLLINGQFGYRDNTNATTSFIGDFDVRYLLFPNGNLAVRVYNQTNDRYFIRNSLNTQGIGFVVKKDFNTLRDLFSSKSGKEKTKHPADSAKSEAGGVKPDTIQYK